MKICIVSYIAPYTIPYINTYFDIVKSTGNECDVVFWDRDGDFNEEGADGINYLPYRAVALQNQSRVKRYLCYFPATKHIIDRLKKVDYDRVIFLQTHAAVACKGILEKKYKGKYIVDIRDFTLENIPFYRNIEQKVIQNSYSTVISSRGYKKFLPDYDYKVVHNYTEVDAETLTRINNRDRTGEKINISFIGYVRFYEIAKKLLMLFKDDERFSISFVGMGAEPLRVFCVENGIENAIIVDKFSPEQTVDFYEKCDIINNLYGNNSNFLDYALSNKLYYAAQLNIPILMSENTYSGEIAEKYNLGFTWNPDGENATDRLYELFTGFDKAKCQEGSRYFLRDVIKETNEFKKMIKEFLTEEEN